MKFKVYFFGRFITAHFPDKLLKINANHIKFGLIKNYFIFIDPIIEKKYDTMNCSSASSRNLI